MYELDFSLLPKLARGRVFIGLPIHLENQLEQLDLPNTRDRLKGASQFFGEVSSLNDTWLNRAYLRAGLNEFRSVPQALRWDLDDQELYKPVDSKNPLIHLVFRLRRLSVYRRNPETSKGRAEITVRLGDRDHTSKLPILKVEDIEQYLNTEDLDLYREEDITRICNWFEKNQESFGAPHIFDISVILYCEEICEVYSSRAKASKHRAL